MSAYYNENDAIAAAWLEELIAQKLIAPGIVDKRSITEVRPEDLRGFTQCHFFAGIGGWSYALRLAGWPDDKPVWTGSCPCQPFSVAGKGKGAKDERHLWPDFWRLISARRPEIVYGEQVAQRGGLAWWDLVCDDLARGDYAQWAAVIPAGAVGAPHRRERLYWMADSDGGNASAERLQRSGQQRLQPKSGGSFWSEFDWLACTDGKARPVEPGTFPLAHGIPARMGRLRGYGNAIVPQVAAEFIRATFPWEP